MRDWITVIRRMAPVLSIHNSRNSTFINAMVLYSSAWIVMSRGG